MPDNRAPDNHLPGGGAPGWMDSKNPARYFPALDGLRALAVASVFFYHLGSPWAGGGYLGVDVFFVISGYLITSILVGGRIRRGKVALRSFWARRARRLLPALFLMLAVTSIAAYVDRSHVDLGTFRWDAISTLFYFANWHEIVAHQSYFAQFAAPSPLEHTWSLAIEEQFYLVWPLLVAGCLALAARKSRFALGVMATVLGVASVVAMALAYHGQTNTSDVYFSTFTRAFELLVGAGLALLLLDRPALSPRAHTWLDIAGLAAFAGLATVWSEAAGPPGWMYRGGFLATCVLAAVIIAAAAQRGTGLLGRALSTPPLRYLGRISYGLYLWHWPVIVFLTPTALGFGGVQLDLVRAAITLTISVASFHLIEIPLRRASYQGRARRALLPAAVALTAGIIVVGTLPTPATAVAGARIGHAAGTGDGPAKVAGGPYPSIPSTPISLHLTTPISRTNPLRVMVIGDSVMWTEVPGFTAAMAATGEAVVDNASIPGWGLTTSTDWRTVIPRLISQYHPELVMGMWSWDNTLALEHPARFKSLLSQLVHVVLAPGNGVQGIVFFQFPTLGPLWTIVPGAAQSDVTRTEGVKAWDADVAGKARSMPGKVMYLQVGASVEVKGKFSAWLPNGAGGWTRGRMIDNTHFCPWGAAVFASAIVTTLEPIFHLPPPSGDWWTGLWTLDPRYDNPQGSCPDDQPPAGNT